MKRLSSVLGVVAGLALVGALACGSDNPAPPPPTNNVNNVNTNHNANNNNNNVNTNHNNNNNNNAPPSACSVTACATCAKTQTAMYINGNFDGWATKSTGGGKAMKLTADHTWQVCLTIADPSTLANSPNVLQFKFDNDDNWGSDTGASAWNGDAAHTNKDAPVSAPFTSTYQANVQGDLSNISVAAPSAMTFKITFMDDASVTYKVELP